MSDETFGRTAAERAESAVRGIIDETPRKPGVRGAAGKIQDVIDKAADAVAEKAADTSDRARDILEVASERVQATVDTIDPFVKARPYATLGIGLAVGMVLGLLLAGRGPKVIYVKPHSGH